MDNHTILVEANEKDLRVVGLRIQALKEERDRFQQVCDTCEQVEKMSLMNAMNRSDSEIEIYEQLRSSLLTTQAMLLQETKKRTPCSECGALGVESMATRKCPGCKDDVPRKRCYLCKTEKQETLFSPAQRRLAVAACDKCVKSTKEDTRTLQEKVMHELTTMEKRGIVMTESLKMILNPEQINYHLRLWFKSSEGVRVNEIFAVRFAEVVLILPEAVHTRVLEMPPCRDEQIAAALIGTYLSSVVRLVKGKLSLNVPGITMDRKDYARPALLFDIVRKADAFYFPAERGYDETGLKPVDYVTPGRVQIYNGSTAVLYLAVVTAAATGDAINPIAQQEANDVVVKFAEKYFTVQVGCSMEWKSSSFSKLVCNCFSTLVGTLRVVRDPEVFAPGDPLKGYEAGILSNQPSQVLGLMARHSRWMAMMKDVFAMSYTSLLEVPGVHGLQPVVRSAQTDATVVKIKPFNIGVKYPPHFITTGAEARDDSISLEHMRLRMGVGQEAHILPIGPAIGQVRVFEVPPPVQPGFGENRLPQPPVVVDVTKDDT
jgi:hypothetical protein